ncbi:MAG: 4-hydroxy-tetrahydrodipicolinate reductase [Urechidicola sp.]|jgi:4-hydroxy-tetrahydrodipicolinate reductase
MKIALLGYGRMGKAIEEIALDRNHEIILKIDLDTKNYDITLADIAIDFSTPTAAYSNIKNCIENGVPVVSGTTGWLDQYQEILALCDQYNGSFIAASNFSLGVNVFFELNQQLAKMMAKISHYEASIEEIHHTQKLDSPSGTAITLAEGIIEHTDKKDWTTDVTNSGKNIPIISKRIPEVPGTHKITYTSTVDTIEIKHTAHNRHGFALGAIIAAEWLIDKKGVYTMKDVLGI